jgi:hypothetical protein
MLTYTAARAAYAPGEATPQPTSVPTAQPTLAPTTSTPTLAPSAVPTTPEPTATPTLPPGETYAPTSEPSDAPTSGPTAAPTFFISLRCPSAVLGQLSPTHKADGGSKVFWTSATAIDVSGADRTSQVSCSRTSGGMFGTGSTTVTCSTPDGNSCTFPVTLPVAQYHFFEETPGQTASAQTPIALDRVGSMHLFGRGGASIVNETSKGVPALLLDNAPIFPPRAYSAMDTVESQVEASTRALSEWTMVVYARPSYNSSLNFGLGQLSGGEAAKGLVRHDDAGVPVQACFRSCPVATQWWTL